MDKPDKIALKWMLENDEHDEIDRVFATNGILYEMYMKDLTQIEHDDLAKILAIGIQAFNMQTQYEFDIEHDLRRLPRISISGNGGL